MEENSRLHQRIELARKIEAKRELITKLRNDLQHNKKSLGNSVDDQIVIAEMEYRLGKEEMALLTLQEQHWKSAALWNICETPDIQKHVCEVLHSYITSVKEKGAIPALHASEHLFMENSILISSQGDKPSIPVVEWAHHSTDLQIGDRLLEINGHSVIGKEPSDVNRILEVSRPLCRIVFLRPISIYELLKNNGCRETSNLRQELTSVVSRLNHKMIENEKLKDQISKVEDECEEVKIQNHKLKLQVISLHSVLMHLYEMLERNFQNDKENIKDTILSECPNILNLIKKLSNSNGTSSHSNMLQEFFNNPQKSLDWNEMNPIVETFNPNVVMQKSMDSSQNNSENR